jgi:signal peptidase I
MTGRGWGVGAVALAAGVLLGGCGATTYKINSPAMEPALKVGQTITVDKHARVPHLGAIVVFYAPRTGGIMDLCVNPNQGGGQQQVCGRAWGTRSDTIYVKRVVGLPGDSISMVNGLVIRDGKREADAYVRPCDQEPLCNFPQPVVVPRGEYFMLGDNRGVSLDSRIYGPVPGAWIIGTVTG